MIIGGGISGTAAAWELAREGHAVTLVEARGLAAMASGWTLGGVRQSARHPAELPLAREAVQVWGHLDEILGAKTGYRRAGNMRLARNDEEAATIKALVHDQRALGLDLHYLEGPKAVLDIVPVLSDRIVAASFCPTDGHADPIATVKAYANAAQRHRTEIREGVSASRLMLRGGRVVGAETTEGQIHADCTVLAAGVHSPNLLAPLGLQLPLDLKLVSVLQTVPLPHLLDPVLGVANADCAGRQEIDGRLRVTSGIGSWTGSLDGWHAETLHPTAADVSLIGERLSAILPAFRQAPLAKVWGGLIDLTPDALPALDAPEQAPGLVIAAGFSGHGFGLGPVTGQILADLALGRASRHPIKAFRSARFRGLGHGQAELTLHG